MSTDIRWRHSLAEGLASAKERELPIFLKPLGQGMTAADDW